MKVPLLDLKPQYAQIKDELLPELLGLIESQAFILGPKVEKMEADLAQFMGVKYAVGVSSGSDALLLALMALKIGRGDEVITTPYTFFATAGSIARVGATPVFVDIEPDTYNINADLIEAAITPRTKAILPVHLFGQCADMEAITAIARKHGLKIIEDACQAIGAKFQGRQAGTIGDLGCFSFFPSKNLGCFGDGGLVVTNDENLYQRVRKLRVHGGAHEYHHLEIGINGRLDALQAVVVSAKLPHLPVWTEGRRRNAMHYNELFADCKKIRTPVEKSGRFHIYNQYVVAVERRDEVKRYLADNEIGCSIYYPLSLHEQECFKYLGYKHGDFPNSEAAARQTLALPIYPELPTEMLEYTANKVNEFFKTN